MQITSSYKVEVVKANGIFADTVTQYRGALSYLIRALSKEWDSIQQVDGAKRRFNYAEGLIHGTKNHPAKYPEFDKRFYKVPSYLRRAAVQSALGAISSYQSLTRNWEAGGGKGKRPKLQCDRNAMPVFYRKDMLSETDDPCVVKLKLFHNNDWVWVTVHLLPTDVRYLQRHWAGFAASAPTLEKHYGKYYLRFAFQENIPLSKAPVKEQRICAIDLGINSDAVCTIMRSDGTVADRKFIDFPAEKDHLTHVLNRVKRTSRKNGPKSAHSLWAYATHINKEHAVHVANAIIAYAAAQCADVIVFEHLDFKGCRTRNQKIHMWRKNDIQALVEHRAHRCGIRVSRICAWGTSRLAYDGSGAVTRDKDNKQWATFSSGKRYNCDLNASYNIGARYFIREILKPLPATARSQLLAKVPEAGRRTSATLSTLLALNGAMAA